MEAFSRLLCDAQADCSVRGIRVGQNGPRINYLFFVDDALDFLKCDKPSFTWSSILIAVKALKKGVNMGIGNGCGTRIGTDKWGFEGLDGEVLRFPSASIREILVHDLWLPSQ
ncbi:hypothetical protein J1N35_007527 [Gossypium stocksii]|uniref:Reverse transcriptase domain-containing protein n=1 Tax=Gossypium stocksii TaxID=47602 RepID=A0A9D4AFC0_9ROSI|nr:hypothetical protein J1N35_007527 [Gossypium stocksii]